MRLSDVLRSELVTTGLTATDRDGALRAIADRLASEGAVPDADAVFKALRAREDVHSTAMGHAMAIPHCTIRGIAAPTLMVATTVEPVPFGEVAGASEGEAAVRVFFVLLAPTGDEGNHIKLLARICRLARHMELIEGILAAEDPAGVERAILRVDGEHV